MTSRANNPSPSAIRCGIVLAAGNGTRISGFVYRLRGDDLPKQYINFTGRRSMLEHTFQRAEKLVPAPQLFVVIAREHLKFSEVRRQIAWRPRDTVVIQPENKDTGPGILLPLIHLYKRYPEAAVALFPSDHFVLEEDRFMQHVERAFRAVERDESRIVLLGVEAQGPDPEYGYIVPRGSRNGIRPDSVRDVKLFVEKPSIEAAKKVLAEGGLWNTLVLIFKVDTLLSMFERTAPQLYRSFQPILEAVGTADEQRVVARVYRSLPKINFSTHILQALPPEQRHALSVLPVRGVVWSDWGTSGRLLGALRQMGKFSPALERTALPGRKAEGIGSEKDFSLQAKRIQ